MSNSVTAPSQIAWVPSVSWALNHNRQPGPLSYGQAQKLAIDWIHNQTNVDPCVYFGSERTLNPSGHLDEVEEVAISTNKVVMPKGRQNYSGVSPVILHDNDMSPGDLIAALRIASGHPIVVIEGTQFSIRGWAFGAGAIELTNTATKFSISNSDMRIISSVKLFGGNNAWRGSHEKKDAKLSLAGVSASQVDIASYLISLGCDERAYKGFMSIKGL